MIRTYLVVIDDSPEARVALRFAARRASKTGGAVDVLAVVEPQDFVQWGGVQAAIEEEQRLRIEGVVAAAVGEIMNSAGITPEIIIRQGDPVAAVRAHIGTRDDIAALVLGGGGVMLGRTAFAPATTASADAEEGEHGEEEDHGPEGFVAMDDARAKAAGSRSAATSCSPRSRSRTRTSTARSPSTTSSCAR